jgi:hypothetical protein
MMHFAQSRHVQPDRRSFFARGREYFKQIKCTVNVIIIQDNHVCINENQVQFAPPPGHDRHLMILSLPISVLSKPQILHTRGDPFCKRRNHIPSSLQQTNWHYLILRDIAISKAIGGGGCRGRARQPVQIVPIANHDSLIDSSLHRVLHDTE